MTLGCQVREPLALAVSGVAGSGKSTLGRALATFLRLPLLDLDTLTNPLLDRLGDEVLAGHWLSSRYAPAVREGRYAALLATASEVLEVVGGVVLVAPFTRELAGGTEWEALRRAVAPVPFRMVQLVGDPELFAARRTARGVVRDRHRPEVAAAPRVAVPVVRVDAGSSTAEQLDVLRRELALDD